MKYKNHIPEGTHDLLIEGCELKSKLEGSLGELFRSYGYAEIETPIFEFFDVFTQGKDAISVESMYKFYDSKGRILVLRPDMTVPVARVAGTKLMEETVKRPLRLRYSGRVFRFNDAGFGGQKDMMQNGIELLGVNSAEADAEVIALAVNALLASGLENFKIDIGQIEFFKGLMEAGGFTESETESIRELIDRKDMSGVEQILKEHKIDEGLKETIMNLPNYFGDADLVRELEQSGLNDRSRKALSYLERVIELTREYGVFHYLSVDLGMVQKLNYYTGIIFKGFTAGVGFPVLSGGRYDNLVEKYGKSLPAVGFSVNLNMIMAALEKTGGSEQDSLNSLANGALCRTDFLLGYADGLQSGAFQLAANLRRKGKTVETDLQRKSFEELKKLVKTSGSGVACAAYLNGDDSITIFNKLTNTTATKPLENILMDLSALKCPPPPIH